MTRPSLHRLALPALATLGVLLSPAAFAQAFDAVRLLGIAPGTDGGLAGVGVINSRKYPGADDNRWLVRPLIDYQWRNGWFAGTTNGIGYNFSRQRGTDYGLRLTADFGRDEDRSPRLAGLGDIDPAPEIGAFFNLGLAPGFALTSSLRYGAGNDNDGLVLDLGAAYSTRLGERFRGGISVAGSYVNQAYLQDYFGVTREQSLRSGYAVYTPDAGLRDVRASVSLTYSATPRLGITTVVGVSSLQGDAADSPIVVKKTGITGVLGVAYAF